MTDEYYTAKSDIIETLKDGRQIQHAVKGQRILMSEAVRLGLVKGKTDAGPSETKDDSAPPAGARRTTSRRKASKKG